MKAICDFCGKEFFIQSSRKKSRKHVFCSIVCYDNWQREHTPVGEKNKSWNRVKTNCSFCGKEIYRTPYRLQTYTNHFCNMTCMAEWKKQNLFGDKNPRWNSTLVLCDFCGKEIFVKKSRINKKKHYFCNDECYFKWKKENALWGKDNPNWRSIEKKCDFCGKMICITPYKLKNSKLHFCNKKCFDNWERINKPRGKDDPLWSSISLNCTNCGKEIFVQPSKLKLVKNNFCSKFCYDKWQKSNAPCGKNSPHWNKIQVNCSQCNREMDVSPSRWKRYEHYFCSNDCWLAWKRNNTPKGKSSPRWNCIKMQCAYCGEDIYVKPSIIDVSKNHFCDKDCSANWKKEHYPKGEDNPFFKRRKTQCAYCGKEIWLNEYRIKNFENNFCSRVCMFEWKRENTPRGKDSPFWDGGGFQYYGGTWFIQKRKVWKRAKYVSELSGNNGGRMVVHHIIPLRVFIQKYIDLCLKDILSIERSSFKVLPYDLIPNLIFEEANTENNLIYITGKEHYRFEGMPPTFFEAIQVVN